MSRYALKFLPAFTLELLRAEKADPDAPDPLPQCSIAALLYQAVTYHPNGDGDREHRKEVAKLVRLLTAVTATTDEDITQPDGHTVKAKIRHLVPSGAVIILYNADQLKKLRELWEAYAKVAGRSGISALAREAVDEYLADVPSYDGEERVSALLAELPRETKVLGDLGKISWPLTEDVSADVPADEDAARA